MGLARFPSYLDRKSLPVKPMHLHSSRSLQQAGHGTESSRFGGWRILTYGGEQGFGHSDLKVYVYPQLGGSRC